MNGGRCTICGERGCLASSGHCTICGFVFRDEASIVGHVCQGGEREFPDPDLPVADDVRRLLAVVTIARREDGTIVLETTNLGPDAAELDGALIGDNGGPQLFEARITLRLRTPNPIPLPTVVVVGGDS